MVLSVASSSANTSSVSRKALDIEGIGAITIAIRSEICVESREPGSRFWSLDYDTCFVYVAQDTLNASGEYEVSVPCIDAHEEYESKHSFGELRLKLKPSSCNAEIKNSASTT